MEEVLGEDWWEAPGFLPLKGMGKVHVCEGRHEDHVLFGTGRWKGTASNGQWLHRWLASVQQQSGTLPRAEIVKSAQWALHVWHCHSVTLQDSAVHWSLWKSTEHAARSALLSPVPCVS